MSVVYVGGNVHLTNKNHKIQSYIEAPKPDESGLEMLFDNLDLILKHKDLILSDQDFYSIKIKGIGAGGCYIGGVNLLLGDLLTLWEYGKWHKDNKYYFYVIGSPLSGSNSASFYDIKERKIKRERNVIPWGVLGFRAFNYVQHGSFSPQDESVVCSGWRQKHDITQYNICDLINKLKQL